MPPRSQSEVHIAGLLVQAWPEHTAKVAVALGALPGLEVRATAAAGRLVVIGECASGAEIVALIDLIRAQPGVLDVALVYQHAESAAAMEEELSDETDPPRVH
jgi:nitrate reductase NapD